VGVDALIFGVVDAYSVDEQTGVSKIETKIGTGEYRTVEKKGKDDEVETVQEEIKKTVLIDRGYIIREGTIGVTFRMANINTGQIVAVETESANFSQKTWEDEANELPSKDAILDDLSSQVVKRFLNKIQPRYVQQGVEFESNDSPFTKLGIKYAQAGLWDKAEEAFKQAASATPAESKIHYNLGITYNVLGKHQEAISSLERALTLDPKDKYINTLARFRQDAEAADILQQQSQGKE
jgi:tetratricopeptide (TPR) repeat protein